MVVDAAEVGLTAMRVAMRRVAESSTVPPPPPTPPPPPSPKPAVAAIVRFAAANAAANASHEARLLAADAANAHVAAPTHKRGYVQGLVSCGAAPLDEHDDGHRLEELRQGLGPAARSVACNTEPVLVEALELGALRAEVASLKAELHHARNEIESLRLGHLNVAGC